jgi:hypothetical protein
MHIHEVDLATVFISAVAGTGAMGYTGDGGLHSAATFNRPQELDVDRSGHLFIVDTENQASRDVDSVSEDIRTAVGTGRPGGE